MRTRTFVAVAVVGLALLLAAGAADARGPKASLLSATECALDLGDDLSGEADLMITTTVTNKSSGLTVPELRDGSQIQGKFKQQGVRGNVSFYLDAGPFLVPLQAVDPVDPVVVTAIFDLCAEEAKVNIARELNGEATMVYGISLGSEDDRTVVNRCTDDPDTEEVDEGGIKVDAATFSAIAVACGW